MAGLRSDAEAHWLRVENKLKQAADTTFYEANGDPRELSVEQWAGVAARNMSVLVKLWGEGFEIMRSNAPEVVDLLDDKKAFLAAQGVPDAKLDAAVTALDAAVQAVIAAHQP